MRIKQLSELKLVADNYVGVFYKRTKDGKWRKFDTVGNSGVASSFASMLERLGHKVTYEWLEEDVC